MEVVRLSFSFFHPSFLILHSPSQLFNLALREELSGEQGYAHAVGSQAPRYLWGTGATSAFAVDSAEWEESGWPVLGLLMSP